MFLQPSTLEFAAIVPGPHLKLGNKFAASAKSGQLHCSYVEQNVPVLVFFQHRIPGYK